MYMYNICGDLEKYKEFDCYICSCKTYSDTCLCIADLQKKYPNNKFWIEQ